MIVFPGYTIEDILYENDNIHVFRAESKENSRTVVIKALKNDKISPNSISSLLYEYKMNSQLAIPGIVKAIKLEHENSFFALIFEDTGGISLKQYINDVKIEIETVLDVAMQVTKIIADLHRDGVAHRDLKLENVVINPRTKIVSLIDFGSSSTFQLWARKDSIIDSDRVESDLSRTVATKSETNTIDYREDFHQLGKLLFDLLTVYTAIEKINHTVFPTWEALDSQKLKSYEEPLGILFDIVAKLINKDLDERYQSAFGLLKDLEICFAQWKQNGKLEKFALGEKDISIRFKIPLTLFGRDSEVNDLKLAYEKACMGQAGIFLVSGAAGVGKSKLVYEGLKPTVEAKGFFISGKFDQLRQNKPYEPFASAFRALIKRLASENQKELEKWKKRLIDALGENSAVITDLIPELEWLIGSVSKVEVLTPKESQNRFLIVFRNFVKAFAKKEKPLVLFLDDLQWADAASLRLLEYLLKDSELTYFLCICAYRNEVFENSDEFSSLIKAINKDELGFSCLALSSLDFYQVSNLISKALQCSNSECISLSEIIFRKSSGNPFYIWKIIESLYEQKLLCVDSTLGSWVWNLSGIENIQIGNDIVGLISDKLIKLPLTTIELLKIASCLGNNFNSATLSIVAGISLVEVENRLSPAILDGLIVFARGKAKEVLDASMIESEKQYEFFHDWIQHAIYSSLLEDEKKLRHLHIGRTLLKNLDKGNLSNGLLNIMGQFNRSLDLIKDSDERRILSELNFKAGAIAKEATAYESARDCLKSGLDLLPADCWKSCRDLAYSLHIELAQCEYMLGRVEEAEKLFDFVLCFVEDKFEMAAISNLKMNLYAGTGKYKTAVDIGIRAMSQFGIRLKPYPGKLYFAKELLRYKYLMRNKKIDELLDLQEIKDFKQLKISELMVRLACVASVSFPDLYSLIFIMAGNHAITFGNSENAAMGFIGYGILEGSILGNYAAGTTFGEMSVKLIEKYDKSSLKCIVYFTFGAIVSHWTKYAKVGLEYLQKGVINAVKAGDVLILGFALNIIVETKFILGEKIDLLLLEAEKFFNESRRLKHENLERNMLIYRRHFIRLKGNVDDNMEKSNFELSDDELEDMIKDDLVTLVGFFFTKLHESYISGDFAKAIELSDKLNLILHVVLGFLVTADINFYHSLSITALYEKMSHKEKQRRFTDLISNQKKMKKWSEACNENFTHKYLLVEAEKARVLGKNEQAMELYENAIKEAKENGFIQHEALANELAAKFYENSGYPKIATVYFGEAYNAYKSWGAISKAEKLRLNYPSHFAIKKEKDTKGNFAEIRMQNLTVSSNSTETQRLKDEELLKKFYA